MATDEPPPAHPHDRSADDASTLAADVHQRSREVIESELRRLAGRVSLHADELDVIDATLHDLVEELFLARLRHTRQHATQLTQLFGVATRHHGQ